jgi:transglutaminase-like putative cysteine protease
MKPEALPFRHLLWLLTALAVAVTPHVGRLPWWVTASAAALMAWRLYIGWRHKALPNRWLLLIVALTDMAGVYLTYRTIFGRDAGVAMLVLLLSLKLLEMKSRRDVFVMVFLAYFIALTNFFYSQTIATAGLMLVTVLMITAALVGLNAPQRPMRANLKTSSVMLLQATPLMLLLFFLFPRVQGPLWGMPQDAFAGQTGLSDTMSPGSLSKLIQSDAIAFRAKFAGEQPARRDLYWRGPVLSNFDGYTWRAGFSRLSMSASFTYDGAPVEYEVTLEPHNRNWLFALEMPALVPANARPTSDYQILSLPPVRTRLRYDMRSYPRYVATGGAEPAELRQALALPRNSNPQARALAAGWRSETPDAESLARRAVEYIRAGKFQYTLEPPLLGQHSVDEFLFTTKQGFCEHYASSFVFLMRASGVPARVVTGYQGGDINPVDGYMVVRQSDAHAWAEVWLGERGWVRVDPTAAASPTRLDQGIASSVPENAGLPLMVRANSEWLRSVRNNWEALANRWNQWVLGYNPEQQRQLLGRLGMDEPNWQNMALILFWSVAAVLLLIGLSMLRTLQRADPVQGAWLSFCNKLARAGITRAAGEGPLDFAQRAARQWPARERAVRAIADLYADLRYGRQAERRSVARLKHLVREFKP